MAADAEPKHRYALSAWLFLRLLGLVYLVAFVSLWAQLDGLFGSEGIAPVAQRMQRFAELPTVGFWDRPTLAWVSASDGALHGLCAAGVIASVLLLVGVTPLASLFACWVLYLSFANVGAPFLSFQWDALLLETGFAALLIAPMQWLSLPTRAREPWRIGRWVLYLLLFRLMLASGIVKLASGDPVWRDLTALEYHYETQPLPHVLGWWVHQLPDWAHAASTAGMFVAELAAPFLVIGPAKARRIGFVVLAGLQGLIAATGNYGFFNLLTVTLCVLLLDDDVLVHAVPKRWRGRLEGVGRGQDGWKLPGRPAEARFWMRTPRWVLAGLVAVLSASQLLFTAFGRPQSGVAREVLASVGSIRSFNRYGLFADMTTTRPEIVIEGSRDGRTWKEYRFEYKPVDVKEAPAFAGLHMPRLDWQMWFAALGNWRRNRWLLVYMRHLLEGRPEARALIAHDPFADGEPPRYIRAILYDYRFTTPDTLDTTGAYWRRARLRPYTPTLQHRGHVPPP